MKKLVICKNCKKEEYVFPSRAINYKYCSKKCMSIGYNKIKFNKEDMINSWKIINDLPIRKYGRSYINVQCTCGSKIIKDLPINHYLTKKSKGCEKCSRFHTSKGFGLISGTYWSLIQNGAYKRNIEFSITIEDAWNKFNGVCALTGLKIEFEPNSVHKKGKDNRRKRTASLDRINSDKGYTLDNIQWVHKDVNIMKNKYNQEYFKKICKLVCKIK